jgi:methylmalonyl-CoA/ethylmalonyl-CoA epimerase
MLERIDHLGIAVPSLAEAVPHYERALGLRCEKVEEVPRQKVRTAFFRVGETHLELLEPTSPDSPIAKFLEKHPRGGVHHVAFATGDIASQLARAADAGCRLVAFLHPHSTHGVLTEFCAASPSHGH